MNDTIAAIATPGARSAVGILRLSGPAAVAAASAVFRPASGKRLEDCEERQLIYGTLSDRDSKTIDTCLATFSRGPHSYTGEDTAELQCHGSPTVLALGLEALFARGVRQASAGEFTRRAFLNGKLDLMQAEAVADLLDAEGAAAVHTAAGQLGGALSRRVEAVYDGLTDLMAHFHVVLDYPDEDIDPFRAKELEDALAGAEAALSALLETYERGRFLVGGVPCVLLGRANAGKSSLLNALLGYQRAIVSDVPGTTRDTVEETVRLGGVRLRLVDTAGLRETGDRVEALGVQRSRDAALGAQLALLVLDGSRPLGEEDREALELAARAPYRLAVANKADLGRAPLELPPGWGAPVPVCALTGQGLEELAAAVAALFPPGAETGVLLTNARQAQAAGRALEAVRAAGEGQRRGVTPDAVLTDVEGAMEALGALTGRSVREDVVGRIFARFCVGK